MDDPEDKILPQLQALRDRYAATLPAKIGQIRTGMNLLRTKWNYELLRTLHRQTHSLAGSGATFGYEKISSTARKLELVLKKLMESNVHLEDPALKNLNPYCVACKMPNRFQLRMMQSLLPYSRPD